MVNIQHILQGTLSNSSVALGVFEEDMSCTGLGKLLWGKTAAGLAASTPVAIVITDLGSLQHLEGFPVVPCESQWQSADSSMIVDAVARVGRTLPKLDLAAANKPIFIDSLEMLALAHTNLKSELSALVALQQGCYVVINSDLPDPLHEFCRHFASIVVKVERHRSSYVLLRCSHLRQYTKYSTERWRLNLDGIKFAKYRVVQADVATHSSTFRLELTEAEKQMKDSTPLPYEKASRLVTVEAEDAEPLDEEGDEDEFY